jgi:hypothetical protein
LELCTIAYPNEVRKINGIVTVAVRFINHPFLTISKLRAEQGGSIAYSLREALSVLQKLRIEHHPNLAR